MDVYVKWLGELVWRMTKWPEGVYGSDREESFWYRTYGVASLILALAVGWIMVTTKPEPLARLVAIVNTSSGTDKLLAQSYIGVGLVLVVGVPMLVFGIFLLATLILMVTFGGVTITKGIALAITWATNKWLERQPPDTQRTIAWGIIGGMLGVAAGIYAALNNRASVEKTASAADSKTISSNTTAPPAL